MKTYSGKGVYGGIAIGRIYVWKKNKRQVRRNAIDNPDAELERYERAKREAAAQLKSLYDRVLGEVGEADAAIFEIHQMLLEDADYNEAVEQMVRARQVNVEYAVAAAGEYFAKRFAEMEDGYLRERAADVRDISERLLAVLTGEREEELQVEGLQVKGLQTEEPVIIAAEDLTPSETVQLDRDKALAFVTVHGSVNSHTAILAKTMGIPALVAVEAPLEELDGKLGIVDGSEGLLYVEPDEETLAQMKKRQQAELAQRQQLQALKGKANVTLDGRRVMLCANIGNVRDLPNALQNDAEGIGLFRSEFLYLKSDHFPTEEEQFQVYKTVAETMAGKRAIIRTMDIGVDKTCDYFHLEAEENPALGYRGIRISLTRTDVFKTQLKALFRASAFGRLAVMYPMIISVDEIRRIQELAAEVRKELSESGVPFGEPEQGIMIETPAAVMLSRELAREVDFFSIGTNDLTQYTLAIDRQNPRLDAFYDAHHPAVLGMIAMVVENAHRENIWVGICGDLAADTELTAEFLRMGVDELSVPPDSILSVRRKIRETRLTE